MVPIRGGSLSAVKVESNQRSVRGVRLDTNASARLETADLRIPKSLNARPALLMLVS
jgi:hypothetical protein